MICPKCSVLIEDEELLTCPECGEQIAANAQKEKINAAYEANTIQWAPYIGSNGKLICQNAHSSGTRLRWNTALTKAVFEMRNNEAGPVYVALRFRAPGTGNYQLIS